MEFAKRLYRVMVNKGWRQADLSRAAGIARDSISAYVNGRHFPDPLNLDKLSKALGMLPEELLPNAAETAIEADTPAFEVKASTNAPSLVWLRVNQLTTMDTALEVGRLLNAAARERKEG